jgi:hypothetical protein
MFARSPDYDQAEVVDEFYGIPAENFRRDVDLHDGRSGRPVPSISYASQRVAFSTAEL